MTHYYQFLYPITNLVLKRKTIYIHAKIVGKGVIGNIRVDEPRGQDMLKDMFCPRDSSIVKHDDGSLEFRASVVETDRVYGTDGKVHIVKTLRKNATKIIEAKYDDRSS